MKGLLSINMMNIFNEDASLLIKHVTKFYTNLSSAYLFVHTWVLSRGWGGFWSLKTQYGTIISTASYIRFSYDWQFCAELYLTSSYIDDVVEPEYHPDLSVDDMRNITVALKTIDLVLQKVDEAEYVLQI